MLYGSLCRFPLQDGEPEINIVLLQYKLHKFIFQVCFFYMIKLELFIKYFHEGLL
jgi:hypothetical protein